MRTGWFALGFLGCAEGPSPNKARTQPADHAPMADTGGTDTGLESFEVTGQVVDSDGAAVREAMVLVGGEDETMVMSNEDGEFSLWYTELRAGTPAIVAAKMGYRAGAFEFFKAGEPITITIRQVSSVDNEDYVYQDPGNGENSMLENCSHCHTSMVRQFLTSGHAEATKNPKLQDLYAGVSGAHETETECTDAGGTWATGIEPGTAGDTTQKCYLGGGVLPDLNPTCGDSDQAQCDSPDLAESDAPTAYGSCADCHAPGINGKAGGRDLHEAHGLAFDKGVHCDTCHKVRDIDMSQPPGVGQRLVMGRPSEPGRGMFEWDPVYYGPIIDVPNVAMGGSHQPKFNEAVFCAGCHEQNQPALIPGTDLDAMWEDGLPVHSTFSEWEDGPYNSPDTPCQFCHMPGDTDANINSMELATPLNQSVTFGWDRPLDDIRQHTFQGPLDGSPRLIDTALFVSIDLVEDAGILDAQVSVSNVGCGHAVPTGEPMRSVILLVQAEGSCGPLLPAEGPTVPDGGGSNAAGTVGEDASVTADGLWWPTASVSIGDVVRAVRPTGTHTDYDGVGAFEMGVLDAENKGMELMAPMGRATVTAVDGDLISLDAPLDVSDGDRLFSGSAWPTDPIDGQESRAVAGHAGTAFARVLVDAEGNRHVPHYRAVGMASDNRIKPGTHALSEHGFDLPTDCTDITVRATVLYRPVPIHLAELRGWEANDYIIAEGEAVLDP